MAFTGKMARFMKEAWKLAPVLWWCFRAWRNRNRRRNIREKERKAKIRYYQMLEKERCLGIS